MKEFLGKLQRQMDFYLENDIKGDESAELILIFLENNKFFREYIKNFKD